jgi:mxaK protein
MVKIRRTLITLTSVVALVTLASLATRDGLALREADSVNARIAGGLAQPTSPHPEELFAAAVKTAGTGKITEALALYNRVENDDSSLPTLRLAARFNSGNLYLRDAIEAADAGETAAAIPNFELAKASYRSVLRSEPLQMDARYNLERALRRNPEAELEETEVLPPPPKAERSVTTMQVEAQGLP